MSDISLNQISLQQALQMAYASRADMDRVIDVLRTGEVVNARLVMESIAGDVRAYLLLTDDIAVMIPEDQAEQLAKRNLADIPMRVLATEPHIQLELIVQEPRPVTGNANILINQDLDSFKQVRDYGSEILNLIQRLQLTDTPSESNQPQVDTSAPITTMVVDVALATNPSLAKPANQLGTGSKIPQPPGPGMTSGSSNNPNVIQGQLITFKANRLPSQSQVSTVQDAQAIPVKAPSNASYVPERQNASIQQSFDKTLSSNMGKYNPQLASLTAQQKFSTADVIAKEQTNLQQRTSDTTTQASSEQIKIDASKVQSELSIQSNKTHEQPVEKTKVSGISNNTVPMTVTKTQNSQLTSTDNVQNSTSQHPEKIEVNDIPKRSVEFTNKSAETINTAATPASTEQILTPTTNNVETTIAVQVQSQKSETGAFQVSIEIPDEGRFPLLAQTVRAHASRLSINTMPLAQSLTKLLSQLDRLHQWSSEHKRSLRSESGQNLNKAVQDTQKAIQELQRYLPKPEQLRNGAAARKALRESGVFLEQKQQQQRLAQSSRSMPTLHQDIKAHLQRLVAATLYHVAKLQVTTSQSQASTTAQANLQNTGLTPRATEAQTNKPLLDTLQQRLQQLGNKNLPMDLPVQLRAILKLVLKHSNQALTRTQLQQVANLRPDQASNQWFFELPMHHQKDIDNIQLLLKKDKKRQQKRLSPAWHLIIQFDFAALGKIRAILYWQDQQVDLKLIAQHQQTCDFIEQHLNHLQTLISAQQMQLQSLAVEQGILQDIEITMVDTNHG